MEAHQNDRRSLAKNYLITSIFILPSLALAIPHAVVTYGEVLPALTLLPEGLGALFAFYRGVFLWKQTHPDEYRIVLPAGEGGGSNPSTPSKSALESFVNAALSLSILIFLIFTWVLAGSHWGDSRAAWLGAYATIPMMAAMIMHAYIAYRTMPEGWRIKFHQGPARCANCQAAVTQPPVTQQTEQTSPKMSGGYRD